MGVVRGARHLRGCGEALQRAARGDVQHVLPLLQRLQVCVRLGLGLGALAAPEDMSSAMVASGGVDPAQAAAGHPIGARTKP